jgi:hypothetical protein
MPPSEIVLDAAELITGRVLSESGEAVEAANVSIRNGGNAETDRDGRFTIPATNPPEYQFTIKKIGYAEEHLTMNQVTPFFVEIRLERADSGVFGKVLDSAGNPVRTFRITFTDASNPAGWFMRRFDTEDGRFWVTDVPPGIYRASFALDERTVETRQGSTVIRVSSLLGRATIENLEIRKGQYTGDVVVVMK